MTGQASNIKQQIIERKKVLDDTATYQYGREVVSIAAMKAGNHKAFLRVKHRPDLVTNRYYTPAEMTSLHQEVGYAMERGVEFGFIVINWTGTHDVITVS